MKTLALLAALMFCSLAAFGQPDTLWTRTYGGGRGDDWAKRIISTNDGGYLIVGSTTAHQNDMDAWVVKLASDGWVEWQQWYGESGNDGATAVLETPDGYLLGGYVNAGNADACAAWMARIAEFGDTIWTSTERPPTHIETSDYSVFDFVENGDTLAALCGGPMIPESEEDLILLLNRATGATFGTRETDGVTDARAITVGHQSSFIALGVRWGGVPGCIGVSMATMNVSGITGSSYGGVGGGWVGARCPIIWPQRCPYHCYAAAGVKIKQDDSGYIFLSEFDLVKTSRDDDLSVVWQISDVSEWATSMAESPGGGFVVVSGTSPQLARIHPEGRILWTMNIGASYSELADIVSMPDGYVMCGRRSVAQHGYDAWIVKTELDTTSILAASDNRSAPTPERITFVAYPNPFNPRTTISFALDKPEHARIIVYDLIGRGVSTLTDMQFERGEHSLTFDGTALPSGLYFAHLQTESGLAKTVKMALVK